MPSRTLPKECSRMASLVDEKNIVINPKIVLFVEVVFTHGGIQRLFRKKATSYHPTIDLLSIQTTTFFHIATTPLLYIRLLSPIQPIIQVEHDSKIAKLQLGVLVERIVTILHVESFRLTENIIKAQRGIQTVLEKTLVERNAEVWFDYHFRI